MNLVFYLLFAYVQKISLEQSLPAVHISRVKYLRFFQVERLPECIIIKTCCSVFALQTGQYWLNKNILHGTRSVSCRLGLQHFDKYHAKITLKSINP